MEQIKVIDTGIEIDDRVYRPYELYKQFKTSFKPSPLMVKGDGLLIELLAKLDGEKLHTPKRLLRVRYTRADVVRKIATDLNLLIRGLNKDEFLTLMTEVYDSRKV